VPTAQKAEKALCSLTKKDQIRLLTVRLREGQLDAALETSTFSTAQPYEALSYFWGEGEQEDVFKLIVHCRECNGHHPLGLWANLYSALMHIMLHHTPEGGERILWTDRICIDQSDMADKTIQLAQMPEVYSKAQRVLVWLGKPAPRDADVKACLDTRNLFHVADKVSDLAIKVGPGFDPQNTPDLPPSNDPVWAVFSDVLRKNWYRRVWTLQESVLAKELMVYYGAYSLTWDEIVRLVNVYCQVSVLRHRDDSKEGHRWRFDNIAWITQYRQIFQQEPRKSIHFAHLLRTSMYKDSTNDKDRVFAVLGMADSKVRDAIKPDYSKSLRQIFIEAFRQVILTDPALHFLGLPFERGGGAANHGLPTWCPDLTRWNGCETEMQPPRKRSKPAVYPSSIHISDDDRLHIIGFAADTVVAMSHAPFPGHDIRDPERRWRLIAAYYRESLALAKAAYSGDTPTTEVDPEAAHWRTLIANRHGGERNISTEDAERGYRCYFVRGSRAGQSPEEKKLARTYSSVVLAACNRRKFFRTSGGRVGLAPDACQVGDVVCVFQGAEVPYLLRQNIDDDVGTSTTFSFLGDCYVHGLMDSTIVDQFDNGVMQGREFIIT
jgi:hypothetical protein